MRIRASIDAGSKNSHDTPQWRHSITLFSILIMQCSAMGFDIIRFLSRQFPRILRLVAWTDPDPPGSTPGTMLAGELAAVDARRRMTFAKARQAAIKQGLGDHPASLRS